MTKIGILDDEVIICETLCKYLIAMGYEVPDYAISYEEAIDLVDSQSPDIMLLDINIKGEKTGIDFAKYLRKNHNIPIIFVTSYSDKSTLKHAKHVHPNGYLLKPFTQNDLYAAIEVALSNFTDTTNSGSDDENFKLLNDTIFIKQNSLYVKVYLQKILYIKSDGVYVEIFTCEKKYLIRETLKNLLLKLSSDIFFQIHRSYIINVNYVTATAVNSEYIQIDKETIPLGKMYRKDFLKRLNLL